MPVEAGGRGFDPERVKNMTLPEVRLYSGSERDAKETAETVAVEKKFLQQRKSTWTKRSDLSPEQRAAMKRK